MADTTLTVQSATISLNAPWMEWWSSRLLNVHSVTIAINASRTLAVNDVTIGVSCQNVALDVHLSVADATIAMQAETMALVPTLVIPDVVIGPRAPPVTLIVDTRLVVADVAVALPVGLVALSVSSGEINVTWTATKPEVEASAA